ncbi:MAG: L-seryl-tRNA(Sec) selenium transferase [Candidatus Riflebacteria bacterium HGW-Riflebacteria-1]|jgi:L-seryl-tRNA(Ser) seleniumtransferase|nr:MAG: L-seryl-tRNA(Sec) selenium transferase [Candidatus Riflebacteria bacterium HGW-Riflebacteria-1]
MQNTLRLLPSVDRALQNEKIAAAIAIYGQETVKDALRKTLDAMRKEILAGMLCEIADADALLNEIAAKVIDRCRFIDRPSLRPVLNATGILIHTNMGRAPLGKKVFDEICATVSGYSNLELDLATGDRGSRNVHVSALLKHITGAEEVIVVNNNAAALVLALTTLAKDREVIVSRGELIEIGGSFRVPDILAASGAKMIEVGTTNKTRLSDYANAITSNTAIFLKAHRSNFSVNGFTEEVELTELVKLGKERNIIVLYDLGSGLLVKPSTLPLEREPDVKSSLATGADLVTFSGDKLLGGPQSGIICGRGELVKKLAKAPLMRALRVCKLTLAALTSVARCYLDERTMIESLPLFAMLNMTPEQLQCKAQRLQQILLEQGVGAELVETTGRSGGGTLPDLAIKSWGVAIACDEKSQQKRSDFASRLYHDLLALEKPVLAILKQGELVFDVLTLDEEDFASIAAALRSLINPQSCRQ